jgi:hypothetical protein
VRWSLVWSWFPDLPVKGGSTTTLRIMDDTMALEIGSCVVVTARLGGHAAVDGNGAWVNSTHPAQLFGATRRLWH